MPDWGAERAGQFPAAGQHQFFFLRHGLPHRRHPNSTCFIEELLNERPQNYRFSNAAVDQLLTEQSTPGRRGRAPR